MSTRNSAVGVAFLALFAAPTLSKLAMWGQSSIGYMFEGVCKICFCMDEPRVPISQSHLTHFLACRLESQLDVLGCLPVTVNMVACCSASCNHHASSLTPLAKCFQLPLECKLLHCSQTRILGVLTAYLMRTAGNLRRKMLILKTGICYAGR